MLLFILSVMVVLIVVGVALWLVNKYLATYMQPPILQILNIAVVVITAICVVLWILAAFGLTPGWGPPLPHMR